MAKKKKKVVEEIKTPEQLVVEGLQTELLASLDIFECSKMGFEKRLQVILESDKGPKNINALETESQNTPLMLAAKYGKLKVMQQLMDAGASVDKLGFNNLTALHYAVRNDHLDVTNFLCEQKCDVALEDTYGNTALHDAARMGNLKCVEVLLTAGANLEHTNSAGSTAFIAACLNARGALIDILLKKNVDINATDSDGDTALHIASKVGLARIAKQLLGASVRTDIVNMDGNDAKTCAAWNADVVKLIPSNE